MTGIRIVDITPANVTQMGVFCIKDKKDPGARKKADWFLQEYERGLRLKIALGPKDIQTGFIEYTPGEYAWRPVAADGYLFIHCIGVFLKKSRNQNIGADLIQACEEDARQGGRHGVCVMTSKGPWMANASIFEKMGYEPVDTRGRFVLMTKKWDANTSDPRLIDWEARQAGYQGWHLLYAQQCPWHEKSAQALQATARQYGIDLQVTELTQPWDAQQAPSGFGVYSLLRDGKLLEDHYISQTRFENILRKELVL